MSAEYIKFLRPEVVYSQKNLFSAQIELLNTLKSYQEYKKLRKEEFILKIALKNKLDELKNSLKVLRALLPKVKMENYGFEENPEKEKQSKKHLSLEQEIDAIRKKLASLK